MQHIVIFLTVILFSFSGCSHKIPSTTTQQKINLSKIKTETLKNNNNTHDEMTEEDASEFEDEFSREEVEMPFDPLSGYNRSMTQFNDKIIIYALNPISEAYASVIPQPLRIGLSNFIKNINYPVRFMNNLLQGKFQNISDETERFIVNSTVGLVGIMDPATTYMNIPAHKEDFGQTLGHYGMGPGFHIVLPFLGPSNLRDLAGLTLDGYASPLVNVRALESYKIPQNILETTGIIAVHMINKTSLNLGQYKSIKKDAIDLYPFLKDIYEQKRVSEIND